MKILITGGYGFIGGRLVQSLVNEGHQIAVGTRRKCPSSLWQTDINIVYLDWGNKDQIKQACKSVDVVIHAAGINSKNCLRDPIAALEFNGHATDRLVSASIEAEVKCFIYLSTAHVYCDPLEGRITENHKASNMHPYAASHFIGEQSVLKVNDSGRMRGLVLRLSNVIGAPIHKDVDCWDLLVNDLCRQAVKNRRLILHTDGQQERDFIGLSEVCREISWIISNHSQIQDRYIFNIGSGASKTVISMAQLVQRRCVEIFGFEPKLTANKIKSHDKKQKLLYKSITPIFCNITAKNRRQMYVEEIDSLLNFCQTQFN